MQHDNIGSVEPPCALAGSDLINHDAVGHAIKPGGKLGLAAESPNGAGQLDADLLCGIFRCLALAEPSPGHAVDGVVVGFEQGRECACAPCRGLRDELAIDRILHLRRPIQP